MMPLRQFGMQQVLTLEQLMVFMMMKLLLAKMLIIIFLWI